MKVYKVDRYYNEILGYIYYVYEEGGHISQYGDDNLPKEARAFMATVSFQFMQSNTGRYFHRFS